MLTAIQESRCIPYLICMQLYAYYLCCHNSRTLKIPISVDFLIFAAFKGISEIHKNPKRAERRKFLLVMQINLL